MGKNSKIVKRIGYLVILIAVFLLIVRAFVYDQFVVPTTSMAPALIPGDRILVNKLLFGARIYTSFKFREESSFACVRVRGLRGIVPGDILVFNAPYGYNKEKIAHNINHVLVKRCIGIPGDAVSVVNGFFHNNHYPGFLGALYHQRQLSLLKDDDRHLFWLMEQSPLLGNDQRWTIKNMGPIYVPKKGDTLKIDKESFRIYEDVIQYEQKKAILTEEFEYIFQNNYYFACGDNVEHSVDSRNWGFIPEEFMIGIATTITYSVHPATKSKRADRWFRSLSAPFYE